MKTISQILLVLLFNQFYNVGFSQLTYEKTYGSTNHDFVNSVAIYQNSKYVLSGWTTNFNTIGIQDGLIIMTDSIGNKIWSKKYSYGAHQDRLYKIITDDISIYTLGSTHLFGMIFKLDGNGNVIWNFRLKNTTGSFLHLTDIELSHNNLYCSGRGVFTNGGTSVLIKMTDQGNILWTKHYYDSSSTNNSNLTDDIIELANGDIAIGGRIRWPSTSSYNYLITLVDSLGNVKWSKSYGNQEDNFGHKIIETSSGELLIAGKYSTKGLVHAGLIKLDSLGNVIWAKSYGTEDIKSSGIVETFDHNYLLRLAYVRNNSITQKVPTLVKLDTSGNIIWIKNFQNEEHSAGLCQTVQTLDSGFVLQYTNSPNAGSENFGIIKTNKIGENSCMDSFPVFVSTIPVNVNDIPLISAPISLTNSGTPQVIDVIPTESILCCDSTSGIVVFKDSTVISGHLCTNNLVIDLSDSKFIGPKEWYKNDTILPGEVFDSLVVSSYGYGTFTCQYTGILCHKYEFEIANVLDKGTYLNITECVEYDFNGNTHTKSGQYSDTLQTAQGCDSIVFLDLMIIPVDNTISQNGNTLSSSANNSTYRWIDCKTMLEIPGATSQIYTITYNSSYAVIVTENECSDTSDCISVSTVRVEEIEGHQLEIYPNPTNGLVNLKLGNLKNVSIMLYNVNEQLIFTENNNNSTTYEFELDYPSGVYFIEVSSEGFSKRYKIIKE